MCLWGSRWWIITFRGPQSPKTPILGTWIGILSQICEKFKHYIFRSVYPIDLKFDRQLQPVTGTSWVVSYGGKTFPRWPTSAILKMDISPYLSEKSSDFHDVIKQEALLSQRGRAMLRVCITTLEWCGYPMVKKKSNIRLFVLTWITNVKKSPFSRTAAHIFVSPGDAPAINTQYVAWMERQFNACQTPRSMYYLQ